VQATDGETPQHTYNHGSHEQEERQGVCYLPNHRLLASFESKVSHSAGLFNFDDAALFTSSQWRQQMMVTVVRLRGSSG
jgi:hypothetical protein